MVALGQQGRGHKGSVTQGLNKAERLGIRGKAGHKGPGAERSPKVERIGGEKVENATDEERSKAIDTGSSISMLWGQDMTHDGTIMVAGSSSSGGGGGGRT